MSFKKKFSALMGSNPSKVKLGATRGLSQSFDSSFDRTMPFFRKQSSEAKKRLQHQLYLARESPEATFDVSRCEISEVPSGVYSLCKVLQKETLLLHDNWLSQLKGGGNLRDLITIRVLDLHDNELTSLPDDIGYLENLQVLNVEGNKLKHLPKHVDQLQQLQTLNLRSNKLKDLPDSLCCLKNLRSLDISNNPQLTILPRQLCQVRSLETIILDGEMFVDPPSNICSQGTEAIMTYLCGECGIQYIPPSEFIASEKSSVKHHNAINKDLIDNQVHVLQYESLKERKRLEMMRLEQQMEEEHRLQRKLAIQAAANKKHLLRFVADDQKRFDDDMKDLQHQKQIDRQQMLTALYEAEKNVTGLVNELLKMNEKARNTEELLEQMEQERIDKEQWFIVRQEEIENLRKQEVLINMEKILEEHHTFNTMIEGYLADRDENVKRVQESANDVDDKLEVVLGNKKDDQDALIRQLIEEEALQKEAFEQLQLQKDTKHQRLTSQIDLIEQELAQLSMLEVEQRHLRTTLKMDVLEDKRHTLTNLLIQLMTERDKRVDELRRRLLEMENQRQADQDDYWLVQYQRLMDRKPQSLIDQERLLEYAVIDILEYAGASDHIPNFARHRITIETLISMSDSDLKQIGVHEFGLRKTIHVEIGRYKVKCEQERAAAKLKGIEEPREKYLVRPPEAESLSESLTPSAPEGPPDTPPQPPYRPPYTPTHPQTYNPQDHLTTSYQTPSSLSTTPTISPTASMPTSPSHDVTARGINSECVVCMEQQSVMLFLNCGHVCTCFMCAEPLAECPLCRSSISQRIRLTLEM